VPRVKLLDCLELRDRQPRLRSHRPQARVPEGRNRPGARVPLDEATAQRGRAIGHRTVRRGQQLRWVKVAAHVVIGSRRRRRVRAGQTS
jgi:hypothetical protein